MLIIDDDFSRQIFVGEPAIELRYLVGKDRYVLGFLESYLSIVINAWPRRAVTDLPHESTPRRVLVWFEEWAELGDIVPLELELDNALDLYVFVSRYGYELEEPALPDSERWYDRFLSALSTAATAGSPLQLVRV